MRQCVCIQSVKAMNATGREKLPDCLEKFFFMILVSLIFPLLSFCGTYVVSNFLSFRRASNLANSSSLSLFSPSPLPSGLPPEFTICLSSTLARSKDRQATERRLGRRSAPDGPLTQITFDPTHFGIFHSPHSNMTSSLLPSSPLTLRPPVSPPALFGFSSRSPPSTHGSQISLFSYSLILSHFTYNSVHSFHV